MVKVDTSKVKKWMILEIDGKLARVVETAHTHMGRWGATDTYKLKDIVSWKTTIFTCNAWTILEQAEVQNMSAVFLYSAWDTYTFMENDTWEMYDLDREKIDDVVDYLKENLDVYLTVFKGEVLWVILPPTVSYVITATVPGVKWNRMQAGTKPATIETWLEIQVPLHKNEWDTVVVNTVTWEAS